MAFRLGPNARSRFAPEAAFAVKLRVTIAPPAVPEQVATAGVSDTLIVSSKMPLRVEVLELYMSEPRASTVKTIRGTAEIKRYLSA